MVDRKSLEDTPVLPKAISEATFRVFGVDIKCYVLENGQRVVDADSVEAFFAVITDTEDSTKVDDPGMEQVVRFLSGKEM